MQHWSQVNCMPVDIFALHILIAAQTIRRLGKLGSISF